MKLSIILILSLILISFLGISSTTYFNYLSSEQILKQAIHSNLESNSYLIENSIDSFLEAQENKVELIATQTELSNEELNNMLSLDDSFYDLFVINSSGIVIVSSNPARVGLDRSNRTYFTNARNQTYTSSVYFALVPQEYSISVSTPFHEGVLVGAMKLDIFNKLVENRIGLGETGENLLAFENDKEEVVYFTNRLFSNETLKIVPKGQIPLPMEHALNKKEREQILESEDYRGIKVLSVPNYIEKIEIGMVTKMDMTEAIEIGRNKIIASSLLVSLIFMIIVLVFSFVLSIGISKPIKKLKVDVDEITKGKLDIQLSKSKITEIQSLIDSLNRILATMKLAILKTGLSKGELGFAEAIKAKEDAENKYKILYETSLDARMTIEPPIWNFTGGNSTALDMFKLKNEKEFNSLEPSKLSPKYQPDGQLSSVKSRKMIEKAMKEGHNFFEWTHKRYEGENFPASVLLSKVEEGGKTYLQATVRDLSEKNLLKEKKERSMKLRETKVIGREKKITKKEHRKND